MVVPSSPRSLVTALLIITLTAASNLCWGCNDGERRTLLDSIRPLLSGEFGNLNWDVRAANCCDWVGVFCGGHAGRVVSLSLVQVGIHGVLDATVFAPFSELQGLDLSFNQITSFASGYRGLEKLKTLHLSHNRMTDAGVAVLVNNLTALSELHLGNNQLLSTCWISNLTSLKVVDLSNNSLSEFDGICNLDQVEYLKLDANMLRGVINPCLGKLHQLRYLSMKSNFLQGGTLSNLLSNLTQLETLHLGNNYLTGTFMISSLANNSKLSDMVLSNNHRLEIETETVTWTPLFQLEYMDISNCIVNKGSNGVVPTFLSSQKSLQGIDLSRCSLRGKIPAWLVYNLSYFLLLPGNRMDFVEMEHMNGLGGNMTSQLLVLDLSDNEISMVMPSDFASPFANLQYLDMSSNLLYGVIPSLSEAASLQVLDLSFNRLTGEVLPSLAGNGSVLTSLLLSHNHLTGPVPPSHWSLTELVHLGLENNQFSGRLSPFLFNSTTLKTLNVRNNHLSGIIQDGILSFQSLGVILLGGNDLHGAIPMDLCFNNYLHYLDLSNNRFSGEIPGCFYNDFWTILPLYYNDERFPGNVTQQMSVDFTTKGENLTYMGEPLALMTAIDFSMNQLSGTIPSPLGFLRQLRSLNLSHNRLVGPIPEMFMYLQDMESLDLSHNHLNGSLPVQLANLSFLSSFNVAYNNLSGEIPYQSQLMTFNESSFEGNKNLCGKIINKNCSMPHEQQGGVLSSDAIDTPLLYWSFIAASFALGFWGVIAFLTWNAGCSRRLYALMDESMYRIGWYLLSLPE
uniref:Uncharacterized protein n=1 Tax=Arundo donax TaxID=35708 RepID=A0A0A8XQQ2_ARUDO